MNRYEACNELTNAACVSNGRVPIRAQGHGQHSRSMQSFTAPTSVTDHAVAIARSLTSRNAPYSVAAARPEYLTEYSFG